MAIGVARDMGATMLGGPTFSAVHRYTTALPRSPGSGRSRSTAGSPTKATAAGVRVGLEALNRYESNFINTVGQAARAVRTVGSDCPVRACRPVPHEHRGGRSRRRRRGRRDVLGYVHVAESNRGPLGDGNIDWAASSARSPASTTPGPITFESFSPACSARTSRTWSRCGGRCGPTRIGSPATALAFLRGQLAAHSPIAVS